MFGFRGGPGSRPGAIRRASLTTALLALGWLGSGHPAGAQALPIELGVGVVRNGSPPAELSDEGCAADVEWGIEGRAGLRFSRAVRLEGNLGYRFEGDVSCGDPIDEPVPPTGPFELTRRTVPEAGYPIWSTDARLSFEPSSPAGAVWLRAFGGYGRMWGKGIGYWLAGGGLVFGGALTTVLEFEWNWFDVPFEDSRRTFQDGALILEEVTEGSTSHTELRIRAGFRLRL